MNTAGTAYFSSPLYRKNLHYQVLQKPSAKAAVLKTLCGYILQHHAHDSGIIYCFTVKVRSQAAIHSRLLLLLFRNRKTLPPASERKVRARLRQVSITPRLMMLKE